LQLIIGPVVGGVLATAVALGRDVYKDRQKVRDENALAAIIFSNYLDFIVSSVDNTKQWLAQQKRPAGVVGRLVPIDVLAE